MIAGLTGQGLVVWWIPCFVGTGLKQVDGGLVGGFANNFKSRSVGGKSLSGLPFHGRSARTRREAGSPVGGGGWWWWWWVGGVAPLAVGMKAVLLHRTWLVSASERRVVRLLQVDAFCSQRLSARI